ncbi:sulfatase-like hydrolase/transferase [Flexithrix dorotheae]|uniref:sulfatase-like hydrolase/transferase n=1 Tax=Flexithrix dorotheae TaxID=70993 RepID=UPI001FE07457|nr:sulfatase-like hydrolase/transferase [Flexithrix dorotheae]
MKMLYLKNSLILSIIFLLITACQPHEKQQDVENSTKESPPNIILIMADDLGYECIGSYGSTSYHTPNIDKIASNGMRFENCHSQPICTPSRVQIMTGQYNVRNYTKFGELDRTQVSFGNLFKNTGYKTAIAGKWQLGKGQDSPQHFGFDKSCVWQQSLDRMDSLGQDTRFSNPVIEFNGKVRRFQNGEYGPEIVSDFLCDFIEDNQEGPFFAYYPMILTHCPFVPTPDSKEWDPQSFGSLDYKGDTVFFKDMVAYMDKIVGKIVTKVEELGLSDNTLILFTGDNGTDEPVVSLINGVRYPGGKGRTTDNGTHVPLIASWPGTINKNQISSDIVDFSDFLPTISEAAGINIPSELPIDGISFFPQLKGEEGIKREWIYCWYSKSGKLKKLKEFARNKEYKLYTTGKFYNVMDDMFEEEPLSVDSLSENQKAIHKMLSEALAKYKNVRN